MIFRGRGSRKADIDGRLPKKRGLGQFADLRMGWGRKSGVVLLRRDEGGGGGLILQRTLLGFLPSFL